MINAAAMTLLLLIVGELMAETLALPVPGAALGLVALASLFALRGGPDPGSGELFDFLAPYFPLFFVPAAVGVIASLDTLSANWASVLVAIIVGTAATLVATGAVLQALLGWIAREA